MSILNELRVGLKYEVASVSGPPHSPVFNVVVELDGQKYHGEGASKKVARAKAAEEALKSFIQFPNNGTIVSTSNVVKTETDFTSDKISDENKSVSTMSPRDKNPVMLLNELYPNAVYSFTHNESDVVNRFKTTITIDNETFSGTGKLILCVHISFISLNGILKMLFLQDQVREMQNQLLLKSLLRN